MTLKNLKINADLHKKIKIYCASNGVSIIKFVEDALTRALEETE
jgi:predicted HicB family RNase H-like nuclease